MPEAAVMTSVAKAAMIRTTTVISISVKASLVAVGPHATGCWQRDPQLEEFGDRPFAFAKITALGQGLRMYGGLYGKTGKLGSVKTD
jgi:hypothetical protein